MNTHFTETENRGYPRIAIKRPIDLFITNEIAIRTLAYDIAPGGIQVRCPDQTTEKLKKTLKQFQHDKHAVGVKLILPLKQKNVIFNALCRITYIREISAMGYAIGLHFEQLPSSSIAYLYRYIEESMLPV